MHLTKISGRSLKGGDFDIDLTQAVILTGDNFAGKTRVTDAIQLLLLGYLPELGNTARATFGLASGQTMSVTGTFSTGEHIRRQWTAKGDTVKTEIDPPAAFATVKPLLTVMLNAEEYFALSDQERVNYVFANCAMGDGVTQEAIAARVIEAAPGYSFSKHMQMPAEIPPLQEWVAETIDDVAAEWKAAKDAGKRMQETIAGLTSLRAADERQRPLAAAEEAKHTLQLQIAELADRKALVTGAFLEMKSGQLRRTQIVNEIAQADRDRAAKVAVEEKLKTIGREIASVIVSESSWIELATAANNKSVAASLMSSKVREIEESIKTTEKALAELDGKKTCPYCGATGEEWKVLRKTELTAHVAGAKLALTIATDSRDQLLQEHAAASAWADTEKTARGRLEGLQAQERAALQELALLVPRIERAKTLEEERDRLPANDPDLTTKVEMIDGELKLRKADMIRLEAEIKAATGRAHDLQRLAEAEKGRDKAVIDQASAAVAGKKLREIQGELVEAAFKPMLETANRIFAGVLLSPLGYREGEIGTYRDGQWIGHRTMSGTEKLLTYAAIQAALAAKSPVRVMILDELGRITSARAEQVAEAVLAAIERGELDQFIGIDPERTAIYATAGRLQIPAFNIIKIG